jgi:hypothetical protein
MQVHQRKSETATKIAHPEFGNALAVPLKFGAAGHVPDHYAAQPDRIATYFKRSVTPPTAADTSAPTYGPLSCKITPLAFCN